MRYQILIIATLSFTLFSCDKNNIIMLEESILRTPQRTITIKIKNYCPQKDSRYIDMFANQFSMKIEKGKILIDFDRDGLPNKMDMDNALNLRFDEFDTNHDGYGDLVIFLSGIRYTEQKNIKRCFDPDQDTDNDGLTDCEEDFLMTDSKNYDSDGDLIPDYLELRYGLQPLNHMDANLDPDSDGINNMREVKLNTPPREKNTLDISKLAFKYEMSPAKEKEGCLDIVVSNIVIVSASNGNLIQFGFVEEELLVEEEFSNKFIRKYIRKNIVVPRIIENGSVLEFEYENL